MLSFSKKIENRVVADKKAGQLQKIVEALYNVKTDFFESDFSRLYIDIKKISTNAAYLFYILILKQWMV